MSKAVGYCPRCGISTRPQVEGTAQVCRDCRDVDPVWTAQWPSAAQLARQYREKRERESARERRAS